MTLKEAREILNLPDQDPIDDEITINSGRWIQLYLNTGESILDGNFSIGELKAVIVILEHYLKVNF